jgi:hypothetical protein
MFALLLAVPGLMWPPAAARAAAAAAQTAPAQWVSPALRRGDEVIYMSGPDGVYIYRRRPAFELAGFLFVDDQVTTAGPVLDGQQNLYVVDFKDAPSDSVIDEYHHSGRRFALVRQFTGADWASAIAVGEDGTVYAVGLEGEVLVYAPSGGAPVAALYSRKTYDVPVGVAVDARDDVFVSYQFEPSGLRAHGQSSMHGGAGGVAGCHRRSGEIDEFPAGSKREHCVNSTLPTHFPGPLAFDDAGNLVAGSAKGTTAGDIAILSPPDWDVTAVTNIRDTPDALAFGAPGRLYSIDTNSRVIERTYPAGAVVGGWWLHQPWANGLAVGRW